MKNKFSIFSLLIIFTLFSFNSISFANEKLEINSNEKRVHEIKMETKDIFKRKGLLEPIIVKFNENVINEKLTFELIDKSNSKKYEYSTLDGKLLDMQVEEGSDYILKLKSKNYKEKSINFKVKYDSKFLAILENGDVLSEILLEFKIDNPDVEIKKGWVKDEYSNIWRYYDENGKMHKGWLFDKNVNSWYYLDENGARFSGWRFDSYYNNKYYFDKDGKMHKGWLNENGKTYYFSISGAMQRLAWVKENNNWFYFNDLGVMYKSSWAYYNNNWYYLNKDGIMSIGWVNYKGSWYYLTDSGSMVTGWFNEGGKWYYLDSSGKRVTGWIELWDNWYYLNSSGVMQTGWVYIDGSWYYLKNSGSMVTGWFNEGGKWYYLDSSGKMITGWLKLWDKWYYFNSSGAMQTGWLYYNKEWYYLYQGGSMATGWINDGKWYYMNKNGTWNKSVVKYSYWTVVDGNFRTGDGSRYARVGKDYIIISLSDQRLWLVRNNKLVINTGIVSGKPSTPTVTGNFRIQSKERNRYLRGTDYSVWVDYWMPFYWDYGIHDANWHPGYYTFENPNSYLYRGSHGCVNIYPGNMGTIYNNSYVGMPVIVIR